jgi:hypothetical protein
MAHQDLLGTAVRAQRVDVLEGTVIALRVGEAALAGARIVAELQRAPGRVAEIEILAIDRPVVEGDRVGGAADAAEPAVGQAVVGLAFEGEAHLGVVDHAEPAAVRVHDRRGGGLRRAVVGAAALDRDIALGIAVEIGGERRLRAGRLCHRRNREHGAGQDGRRTQASLHSIPPAALLPVTGRPVISRMTQSSSTERRLSTRRLYCGVSGEIHPKFACVIDSVLAICLDSIGFFGRSSPPAQPRRARFLVGCYRRATVCSGRAASPYRAVTFSLQIRLDLELLPPHTAARPWSIRVTHAPLG